MRILLVAHSFPRHDGDAAGSFLLALARGQQALGHEILAVVPHAAGLPITDNVGGIGIHRFRYGRDEDETLAYVGTMADQVMRSWRAKWRLIRFVSAERAALSAARDAYRPDVIHVHWWMPNGLALPRRSAGRPPVVMTSHGTDLFLLDRSAPMRVLAAPIFRAADEVTVISTPLVARVTALGVPKERVTVVPMPVDPILLTVSPQVVRVPMGTVLFVGRLVERKGAEFAIRAFAEVARGGPATRLVIAGDGPERPRLSALAAELGVGAQVQFLGALDQRAVFALYGEASVFILPAITDWKGEQEGFGMVLVEAMLHGLPVIASRSGGIPDVVRHGETGILVAERDVAGLAQALTDILGNPERAARLGAAARRDAQERFAPAGIARIFDAVYARAVAQHRAAGPT